MYNYVTKCSKISKSQGKSVIKYLKISVKINTEDIPPYFMGSELRGGFGYALKSVNATLVEKLYATNNFTNLYRFDFRLGMQKYEFILYLFEELCNYQDEIISALKTLFINVGLGVDRKKQKSFEISCDEICIFQPKIYSQKLLLTLITPLRIKKQNCFVRDDNIDVVDIISSIYKKATFMQHQALQPLAFNPSYRVLSKNLYFLDIDRWSNRQKTKMQFGGIVGEMLLDEVDEMSFKILSLGEILGVGKQCSFGLGKIEIYNK